LKKISVVDPDPDPNFHVNANPDPDPGWHENNADSHADHSPIFTPVGIPEFFKVFVTALPLNNAFFFLISVRVSHVLSILDSIMKIFCKKFYFIKFSFA
jgi:hypothetical protein